MAKDAHSAPRTASHLPPLDVFQMPGPEELPTAPLSLAATGAARDETPLSGAAPASAEPAVAIEAALPAPHPPEPSTPSVVIDSASLEAELESAEPTAPPDVPTVRLRSTRPPGKRLGREVLLAVGGMAFCLVLYGVGSELLGDGEIPPAASTSIDAARTEVDKAHEPQARAATEAEFPPSPPLEPLAEPPSHDVAPPAAEPGHSTAEIPAEAAATPTSSAEPTPPHAFRPQKPAPGFAPAAAPASPDRSGTRSAAKTNNVFDTPLLPPAE